MLGYQQVSSCELVNGLSLIWAFGTAGPILYGCWLHGTKFHALPGSANTSIGRLVTINTLFGVMSLVANCIRQMDMYEYGDNLINPLTPTCRWGAFQAAGVSVMVWDPLILLETTLTGDVYVSILSDHIHPFISIVHSDGQFQQGNVAAHTTRVATEWLQEHSLDFRHFHCPHKF